jgi:hypothetical protein
VIATKRKMETGDNSHGSSGHFCAKRVPIADSGRLMSVRLAREGSADQPDLWWSASAVCLVRRRLGGFAVCFDA